MSAQSPFKKFMDVKVEVFVLDTSTSTATGQPIEILPANPTRTTKGRFIPRKFLTLFQVGQVVEGKDRVITLKQLDFNDIVRIEGTFYRVIGQKKQQFNRKTLGFEHLLELFRH